MNLFDKLYEKGKLLLAGALIASPLFATTGCFKKTLETIFKDKAVNEYGYTEEQAEVLFVGAERRHYMKEENGGYKIKYEVMGLQERLNVLENEKDTVEKYLNPENPIIKKPVEYFGLKKQMEKNERILDFKIQRYKLALIYKQFQELMQETENSNYRSPYYKYSSYVRNNPDLVKKAVFNGEIDPNKLTDLEIIFGNSLINKLKFTSSYVEEARKRGNLNLIEKVKYIIEFSEEESNPDYPDIDPNNKTRWVDKERKVFIKSFDTDGDKDKKCDYIEVYRIGEDGFLEENPAVKIFHPNNSSDLEVLVVDYDRNKESVGYGLPDEVLKIYNVYSGNDIFREYPSILEKLFKESKKEEREKKETKDEKRQRIEIVKVGDIKFDEFEISDEGWTVPYDYKLDGGGNYTLWAIFEKSKKKDSKTKSLKYLVKKYHSLGNEYVDVGGRVVEFYKPKEEFKKEILAIKVSGYNKMITFIQENKPALMQIDEFFIEKYPYEIDYDVGDKRLKIFDLDGKEKPMHEAKKEMFKPKDLDIGKRLTSN